MVDALVLSAGSTRGAYGLGWLIGATERNPWLRQSVKQVNGCSGNSANAVAFATGQLVEAAYVWKDIVSSKEFMWNWPTPGINIPYLVRNLEHIIDFESLLSADAMNVSISATNLETLQPVYFSNKDAHASKEYISQALCASMSPPFYAKGSVRVGNLSCSDGELTATTIVNTQKVIDDGAKDVVVVYNASETYGRTIEGFLKLTNKRLYDRIQLSNKRPEIPQNCSANVTIFKPSRKLPLRGITDNSKQRIVDTMEIGYDDGRKAELAQHMRAA